MNILFKIIFLIIVIISCVWFFVMAPEGETIGLTKGKYEMLTGSRMYLEVFFPFSVGNIKLEK